MPGAAAAGGVDFFEIELRRQLEVLFLLREEAFQRQEREHAEDQRWAEMMVIHTFVSTEAELAVHHRAEIATIRAHVRAASGLVTLDDQCEQLAKEVELAHAAITNMQTANRNIVQEKRKTLEAERHQWERERTFIERHVVSLSSLLSEQADRAGRGLSRARGAAAITPSYPDRFAASSSSKMIGTRSPPIEPRPSTTADVAARQTSPSSRSPHDDYIVHVGSKLVMNIDPSSSSKDNSPENGLHPTDVSALYSNDPHGGLNDAVLEHLVAKSNGVPLPRLQLSRLNELPTSSSALGGEPVPQDDLADRQSTSGSAMREHDLATVTANTNTALARARQTLALTSPVPPADLS